MNIIFNSPTGEIIENPDMRLINLMVWFGKDFWACGSGQAWFDFEEDEKKTELILTCDHLNNKFHLEYDSNQEPRCVSLGEGDYEQTVSPFVGGDPWVLPTKFFVSADETWLAVEEFCKSGNKTDKITWGKRSEINWEYREE